MSDISSSAQSSDNESILDIASLKPYDHEPRRTSFDEGLLSDDNSTWSATLTGVYVDVAHQWNHVQKLCVVKKPTKSQRNVL